MSSTEVDEVVGQLIANLKRFVLVAKNLTEGYSQQQDAIDAIQALDLVLETDRNLQTVLDKVNERQKMLQQLETLEEQTRQVDAETAATIKELYFSIGNLQASIANDESHLSFLQRLASHPPNVNDIVGLAKRLATTVQPPPGWTPDLPLLLHRPPYPTEDLMRSSRLFQTMNTPSPKSQPPPKAPQADIQPPVLTTTPTGTLHAAAPDSQLAFLDLDLNPDLLL